MTEPGDPTRYWDGQRWLHWDGTAWLPEQPPAEAQPKVPAPPTVAPEATEPLTPELGFPEPPIAATPAKPKSKALWIVAGVLGVVVVLIIVGIAASSGSKNAAPGSQPLSSDTSFSNPFPTEPSASPTDSTPSAEELTGPLGTTYTSTSTDGTSYSFTLTTMTDPGKAASSYESPDAGNRYVAARFVLKGITGTTSDDVYSLADLVGNNDQTYQPDFANVKGCTSFNSGSFKLTPGHQAIGCIMFQVPKGIKVVSIQWGSSFSDNPPATWTVS
jgi:hypothetical protein